MFTVVFSLDEAVKQEIEYSKNVVRKQGNEVKTKTTVHVGRNWIKTLTGSFTYFFELSHSKGRILHIGKNFTKMSS